MLEMDRGANAAYLHIRRGTVEVTDEFSDLLLVDLDELDRVIGVEFLSLTRVIPVSGLCDSYGLSATIRDKLPIVQQKMALFAAEAEEHRASGQSEFVRVAV